MRPIRARLATPGAAAVVVAGLILGGLLVGYEPVGGDPDRIYRPIKLELARALAGGRLPYWSDRLGLGVPLLAESHAAAFYPPNWLLYRALGVSAAYRLAMWLHHLALAAATYAYARALALTPWGAALAAVAFTFCGFLAIHSSHEWAYHALPFLPLCLLLAERFLADGRLRWLALLATAYGAQLTVGHFQVAMWTGVLVLLTGLWRAAVDRCPGRRALALIVAVAWGGAIAAAQLAPTWELTRFLGFDRRPLRERLFYSYPPGHWAELALPRLFLGLRGGPEDPYWFRQETTGFESFLFVGTVPLILACVGAVRGRGRALAPWMLAVPASFALATMPRWWPEGYARLLEIPVVGYFRCPARLTALTSLGLCLLAGRGLDRAVPGRRFAVGVALALLFAAAAVSWGLFWCARPEYRRSLEPGVIVRVGLAAPAWLLGLGVLVAWRSGRIGAWAPSLATAVELGVLYYAGTTAWGWSVRLPGRSPILTGLARAPGPTRVAGDLGDLPVWAGAAPAYPYLGFRPPPPHRVLELAQRGDLASSVGARLLRRYGVTHAIRSGPAGEADAALDRLVYKPAGAPEHARWRLVPYPDPFPPARVATRTREAPDEARLLRGLAVADDPAEVWYLTAERPPDGPSPRARAARLLSWDGRTARVEHDGACDVVLLRTYYPGWTASIDGGPPRPVSRADGGVQAVHLDGSGTTRVEVRYRPTGRTAAAAVSVAATLAAPMILALGARPRSRRGGPAAGP